MTASGDGNKPNVAGGLAIVVLCVALPIWMMARNPLGGLLPDYLLIGLVFAALFLLYLGVRMMGADKLLSAIAAFFLFNGAVYAGDQMSAKSCAGSESGDAGCHGPAQEPEIAAEEGKPDMARPVRVGTAESDFGRCEAIGRVGNLPGGDDNFLAVRDGPSVRARKLAQLDPGTRFYLCDRNTNGQWLGVVYRLTGGLPEGDGCALQASEVGPYDGPCRSGWVSARYVMREKHVVEGGGDAKATQSVQGEIAPTGAMASESETLLDVSHYFCEITEGLSREVLERRRTQGIERGYYLSPVFPSEPGRGESLAENYEAYALRTQDYDLGAKLGAPTCFEFGDQVEAEAVREKHRRDYNASSKFETIETFWRGK